MQQKTNCILYPSPPRYTFSPQILGGLRGNVYFCNRNIGLFGELHSGLDAYSQSMCGFAIYVSRINQAFVREIDFQELEPKATFISTPRNHPGCMLNIISAFLQRAF